MGIHYRVVEFQLSFSSEIDFAVHPIFILRSVLGKELHHLVCLFRERQCRNCSLKYTCAYSWLFETPIQKTTDILPGRDRASHPFFLATNITIGEAAKDIRLHITLVGKAIEYLPYLYYALIRAGKSGVFKERVTFAIEDVKVKGTSIIDGDESIDTSFGIETWQSGTNDNRGEEEEIRIQLITPLRMKLDGRYRSEFSYLDFMNALVRRCRILSSLYGDPEEIDLHTTEIEQPRITERNLTWQDLYYYSSRQGERLKLGGLVGDFSVRGRFSDLELSLLRFGELFNVGKNVAFGLGRIGVERKRG
ncbi:MAG TPA: CRISPR system precrRNA processing endoribonuclease RAMP protein Cas6 [Spirochaetia bacterium]|nr:CRISPR system precrRNA processing endoribonuclease RAMP protein Cas6 [Spirochaetia bacterium]